VIFLSDPFTEYFYPEVGLAALKVLRMAGCQIRILRVLGTGRTLISKGMLTPAKKHAHSHIKEIQSLGLDESVPVVGVEPSEVLTLSDEYRDFFPSDEYVKSLANRSFTVEEYLVRPKKNGESNKLRIANLLIGKTTNFTYPNILLHGHCYQKARPPLGDGYSTGVDASKLMLESLGFKVMVLETGCCGMAGSFGYEAEHYPISIQIGELELLKKVRTASADTLISAAGVSCRAQIEDGTGRVAKHPIEIVYDYLYRENKS
jgi:Fe-S oxidoreductase